MISQWKYSRFLKKGKFKKQVGWINEIELIIFYSKLRSLSQGDRCLCYFPSLCTVRM